MWRVSIEAQPGATIADVRVVRRAQDGSILIVREQADTESRQHVRLERRDAAGRVVWQQTVPGLPDSFTNFAYGYARADNGSLLAITYLPLADRRTAPYGRIVEVDEAAGRLRALGGIARPQAREWVEGDAFELAGVVRLRADTLAAYGSFGSAPLRWWASVMRLDGRVVWQAMSLRAAGAVTSLRAVPGGFEGGVTVTAAGPGAANTGSFRMRFDGAGRRIGSVKMASGGALLFGADGSAAAVGGERPRTLVVEDRHGRRRHLAVVPDDAGLRDRLDDGSFVLADGSAHDLVIAANGRAALHIERDRLHETILADGSIFAANCAEGCRVRELSLHRRPW